MEKERSAYLFQKYINQECSAEEMDEFMSILRNSDDEATLEMILDNYWDKTDEIDLQKDKAEEIFNNIVASESATPQKKKIKSIKMWIGWAAAILVLGIASLLILNKADKYSASVKEDQNKPNLLLQLSESTVAKTLNEHQKVTLPDGSTVILNNNSSVTYPKDFKGDKREVILNGEGYFDIKHDDKKSFTVYTGKLRTIVLGTAFNIKAYEKDRNIEVTVTRGKVSVLNDQATLGILIPNQQIIFNKDYKKSNLARVLAKSIVQWQESDLFFDDISMEEATEVLSKKFNTPITFTNDKAKKCRFTATFLKGESLEEILKVICSFNNAQYQFNAGRITIKGEGCE
ncbi:FecR family protein [Pedobacter fastidiosus]|uniref:FecR family protein n=1 Tax=Pedobacter fastidiosus TaxID=2765361 RepID=A0ABR7KWV1_9SPHI|nr:FecR family protein [Pedobacter fastidiosus]MBC6112586.1 FecR family protein [Pedobacter fastidiosus]